MADPALRTDVVRRDDRATVVAVAGEIDLATAPELGAALDGIEGSPGSTVHLDLAEVSFLDSSGISVLVDFRSRLETGGASLALHRASPTVQRVLEISGLGSMFDLRPDAPA
jgi:anti-sigma B factor antagonist